MVQDTKEQIKLTEEQERDRYFELADKEKKTPEEVEELKTLKKTYSENVKKRIDTLTYKSKEAEERAERAEQLAAEKEKRIAELESKTRQPERPTLKKETIEVGGQVYYTDEALQEMVEVGTMKEGEAHKHQRERDKQEAAEIAYARLKKEENNRKFGDIFAEDRDKVFKEFPHFNKKSADFNADDPLYIEADRIFQSFFLDESGQVRDPRAFSKSIAEAKRNLKYTDQRPDVSDELSVHSSSPAGARRTTSTKEVTLNDDEATIAIRTYVHGGMVNPATQRQYTENEAKAKALKAKKERAERTVRR